MNLALHAPITGTRSRFQYPLFPRLSKSSQRPSHWHSEIYFLTLCVRVCACVIELQHQMKEGSVPTAGINNTKLKCTIIAKRKMDNRQNSKFILVKFSSSSDGPFKIRI